MLRIGRAWEPVQALREERAQFHEQLARSAQGSGRTPLNTVTIPAEKPPFWALRVDDDGRIWVARHQPGHFRVRPPPLEWWEPLVTDVIEPNGRFLGTIRFPDETASLALTQGDVVWVVERGEYDEEYVVKYRIVPG